MREADLRTIRLELTLLTLSTTQGTSVNGSEDQDPGHYILEVEVWTKLHNGLDFRSAVATYPDIWMPATKGHELNVCGALEARNISPGGELYTNSSVDRHKIRLGFIPFDQYELEKIIQTKMNYEYPHHCEIDIQLERGDYHLVTDSQKLDWGELSIPLKSRLTSQNDISLEGAVCLFQISLLTGRSSSSTIIPNDASNDATNDPIPLKPPPLVTRQNRSIIPRDVPNEPTFRKPLPRIGKHGRFKPKRRRSGRISGEAPEYEILSDVEHQVNRAVGRESARKGVAKVGLSLETDPCVTETDATQLLQAFAENLANLSDENAAFKQMLCAWNRHLIVDRPIGACNYRDSLERFVRSVHSDDKFDHENFVLLLFMLNSHAFLSSEEVFSLASISRQFLQETKKQ
ncbi:hypothetical protein DFS34DRAFT_47930 [Phlyctochytrium arcticum]|nr:hypothetical protein DFS34DRAFT_47930 [Phlyctochytrium arcticum]